MNWNYPFTNTEYFFIIAFIVVYVLYVGRTLWAARAVGTTSRSIILKFFLRSIYFGLFILALLGPFFGEPEKEIMAEGKDVFIMVDVSKSMDATDIQPTRLEKVKYELQQLVNTLQENRYGLIVFSSDAFLNVPLTFDTNAMFLFLQSLSTNQTSGSGTDICSALDLVFRKEHNNSQTSKTTKVFLLLTDGENFGDCDKRLLAQIKQYGIHLVVVGVGTGKGEILNQGGKTLKNENGQVAISSLDANFLRSLTTKANGQYFEINENVNEMSAVVQAINGFENRLIDSRKIVVTSNRYQYFLAIALILLVLDILVTVTTFQI